MSQPVQQRRFSRMAATSSAEFTSRKRKAEASWGFTTGQDVLNLAAYKYLQTTDASKPDDLNGFVHYLEHVRKVVIVDVQPGSLIITVECNSLKKLKELWDDYRTGYVSKMAQKFLLTKDVLNELGLSKVTFSTSIPREKYGALHDQLQAFHLGLQRKYLRFKNLRHEFQNQFHDWVSTRRQTRKLLKELETALSSSLRRTELRGDPPGFSLRSLLYGVGAATAVLATAPVSGVVAGVAAAAAFVWGASSAGSGERLTVDQSIDEDKGACRKLYSSLHRLGNCVADFGGFCRDHIDSVLSSELVEGEFRFLLYILRGTHSPRAAANAQVPLPVLLDEEVNIHATRVDTLWEQLKRCTANQEALAITRQIVDEFQEGPNDEEIRTMIMNFIEAKFAEACKS